MATEFLWQAGRFVHLDRTAPGELLVADSWRSESGRVAAFGYHLARFEDAVGRVSQAEFDWPAVWQGMVDVLASETEASLFPRISLEAASLILAVRPCMPARERTTLALYRGEDPRHSPLIKGPDIPRLAAAKATAPADDVILLAEDGALLETTTGALLHWRDGGIVISNRFEQQLASVTLRQAYDRAMALDIPVTFRAIYPSELGDGPLWFLNSVHGVSPVPEVRVGDDAITVPAHPDAADWQNWWWDTLAPIGDSDFDAGNRRTHPSLRELS
ncbi:MAG: aminotransferase class IV [Gulosibacter sp.]|uniref:aminotransferase class IV n=1 Tax=Gulosibacter sp. TaxID=2817531 RepID=UPI003F90B156